MYQPIFARKSGQPNGSSGTTVKLTYTFDRIDLGGSVPSGGRTGKEVMRTHLQKAAPAAFARSMVKRGYKPL